MMKKNHKILKLVIIFLTVVQVVLLLFFAIYSYAFLIANVSFIHFPSGFLGRMMRTYFNIGTVYWRIPSTIITPALMIVLFQMIKAITKDIAKGTGFKQNHIKRIYVIAGILIARGLCGVLGFVPFLGIMWKESIHFALNGLFIGLVVIALAKIFAHGVEVQTDSDMTV